MKKIVTALGNSFLNDELTKYAKYDVLTDDIIYQEGVLDFISQKEVDVLIISGLLQGTQNLVDFASAIRQQNIMMRVVFIVDSISDEEKNLLFSKGIFDILYDENAEIEDVLEAIDREEPISYKAQLQNEVSKLKEKMEENFKYYSNH